MAQTLDERSPKRNQRLQSLEAQAERDRRALDALHNISLACRGLTSFEQLFAAIARELTALLPFDACYIAVCDTQRADSFRAVLLVDEGVAEYCENLPFGLLTGALIRDRQPLLYGDLVAERAHMERAPDTFGNAQKLSRAWLGVPLLVGVEAVGVISLQSYEPDLYNDLDLDLLQRVGNVIAVVLENAWLDQQQIALSQALAAQVSARTDELLTLSAIAAELVLQRPLRDLLERALDLVLLLFDLDAATVRVLEPQRDMLGLAAQRGFAPDYVELATTIPVEGSSAGMVVRENRPLVITTAMRQPTLPWLASHMPYESLLGIPLRIGDRVLGTLSLFGRQERAFSPQTLDLAQAIGNQMAIAIQNAHLFEAQKRQIRELDASGQIGQLISATYDFDDMLGGVYATLDEIARPSVFYLLLCDPDTHVVSHAIFIEEGQRIVLDWVGRPPNPDSITAWIIAQREPLLFQDLTTQSAMLLARGIAARAVGPDKAVRSWVGVPVLARDSEPIGVLALQDFESHCYDSQTVDFLTQVASHISLGVQKVRLFDERERQLAENKRLFAAEQDARRTADTLREVARVLSTTFDPRVLLELMLRELQHVIAYDSASIMLLDRDLLRLAAARGFDDQFMAHETRLDNRQSALALIVRTQEPIVILDTAQSSSWTPSRWSGHIRSWLGVPLVAKGVVLGVLNIDSRQPSYFTQRDIDVAQAFASQAAVALENARLYEESVTRVEQELEIARQIQINLFPQHLPQFAGLTLDARCLPARETGGDFFDFVPLGRPDDPNDLALFIGDASGKSIPGAMLMAIAHSIVRSEARDHSEPQIVMRETNSWIAQDVPAHTFVALCYATFDRARRRMTLANAGQLTPLRRRTGGEIDYLEVPGPRLPLGIVQSTAYESVEVALEPGDLLVFFTDGIVEAKNPQRELFGFERVEALLRDHGDDTPSAFIDRILGAISAFAGGTAPHDDMTIVALRVE